MFKKIKQFFSDHIFWQHTDFQFYVKGLKPIGCNINYDEGQVVMYQRIFCFGWFYMWRDRCPSDRNGYNGFDYVKKAHKIISEKPLVTQPVTILFWCEYIGW
jgi:hypothetical protein